MPNRYHYSAEVAIFELQVFDMATMSWSETGSLPEGVDGNALLPIERGPWAGQVSLLSL